MRIPKKEIAFAFSKSREISEIRKTYFISHDDPKISVDILREIADKYLEKKVEYYVHRLPHEGQPIKGFYLALDDGSYEVVLLGGQNFCWERLVTCKELFHVFMDKDEYRNANIANQIDETTVAFPDEDSCPNNAVASEKLTEIAAMEYLLPYSTRVSILEALPQDTAPDFGEIALQYRIPRVLVEMYLSKHYMDSLNPQDYLG